LQRGRIMRWRQPRRGKVGNPSQSLAGLSHGSRAASSAVIAGFMPAIQQSPSAKVSLLRRVRFCGIRRVLLSR
jgi:hypothetical protein